jgi:Putative prokaryotic signal transducing protein
MKTVYEAANAVEAHMLMDLMQQEGLSPQLLGAHLQSAIGELPAGGLVRLVIADDEYAQARAVIERWEATEVSQTPRATAKPSSGWARLWIFLAGLVVGGLVMYAYHHLPAATDGVDHNGDGRPDDIWRYSSSGLALGFEADRNFDGKADYISENDERGVSRTAKSDDDFDGVFESHMVFENGNFANSETDTNADGLPDVLSRYQQGVLVSSKYLNPTTGLPLLVEYYKLGKVDYADGDTDLDGKLDTRWRYAPTGGVLSKEAMAQ